MIPVDARCPRDTHVDWCLVSFFNVSSGMCWWCIFILCQLLRGKRRRGRRGWHWIKSICVSVNIHRQLDNAQWSTSSSYDDKVSNNMDCISMENEKDTMSSLVLLITWTDCLTSFMTQFQFSCCHSETWIRSDFCFDSKRVMKFDKYACRRDPWNLRVSFDVKKYPAHRVVAVRAFAIRSLLDIHVF